jgi:hypothetical protein
VNQHRDWIVQVVFARTRGGKWAAAKKVTMNEERADGTASVAGVGLERRRRDRRRFATQPGRFATGSVARLEGEIGCQRNDVGEIVEIWVGDRELLSTIIDCNDRREGLRFVVTISAS